MQDLCGRNTLLIKSAARQGWKDAQQITAPERGSPSEGRQGNRPVKGGGTWGFYASKQMFSASLLRIESS
ncbi:hypothetical protein I4000191A8_26540 [Clostridia bacterium i40-0019-1A8]